MFSLIISDINKTEQEGLLAGATGASPASIKIMRSGKSAVILVDPLASMPPKEKNSKVLGKRVPVTQELRDTVRLMRDNNYCEPIDIAVKANCSVQTVRNLLNGKYPFVSMKVVEAVNSMKEGFDAYLSQTNLKLNNKPLTVRRVSRNEGRMDDRYSGEILPYGTNSSG